MSLANAKTVVEVHPNYAFDDADLTLLSSDGTLFHIHAVLLKLSSSVFRDMLSVKRAEGDGPVELTESKETLSILLDMVYGTVYPTRMPPPAISVLEFRTIAITAEKYDMSKVTDALKDVILGKSSSTTLRFDDDDMKPYSSMKAYFMASDLGWTSVATELSANTLSCDLNSEVAQKLLFSEDTPRSAVKELLSLHRERRIWLYNALSVLSGVSSGRMGNRQQQNTCQKYLSQTYPNSARLSFEHPDPRMYCGFTKDWSRTDAWWQFRAKVFSVLETDASGNQFLTEEFYSSYEVQNLSKPCCTQVLLGNEGAVRRHFKFTVEHIPKTMEGFRALYSK